MVWEQLKEDLIVTNLDAKSQADVLCERHCSNFLKWKTSLLMIHHI
ncbi:MAG: hypothetical protein Q4E88_05020 [Coriobacteriia bacterium]|nr:hypothetical protein [Coriobacteriia bacterium]